MRQELILKEVVDDFARQNFVRITDEFNSYEILKGQWKFFEITIASAVTNYKFSHQLRFVPKDIIQTSLTGAGAITWNYTSFSTSTLDITTTGACVVRAFIGRFNAEV